MKPVSFLCHGLHKRRFMSQARRTQHFARSARRAWIVRRGEEKKIKLYLKLCKANKCLYVIRCLDHLFSSIVLPYITYALSVYGASESELTIAQQFLDRCFKRRYISKKLEIGELLKVQDHRICRKVSSIPNHPLRANFPETKITRYNLRNKSPAMSAIHTDRFKNTFLNRIVFKYNNSFENSVLSVFDFCICFYVY